MVVGLSPRLIEMIGGGLDMLNPSEDSSFPSRDMRQASGDEIVPRFSVVLVRGFRSEGLGLA